MSPPVRNLFFHLGISFLAMNGRLWADYAPEGVSAHWFAGEKHPEELPDSIYALNAVHQIPVPTVHDVRDQLGNGERFLS